MIDGHLVKRKGKAAASSTFTLHQWHLFISWQQMEHRCLFPVGLMLSAPLIASERGHKEGKLGFYLNRCMNCSDSYLDTPFLLLLLSAFFSFSSWYSIYLNQRVPVPNTLHLFVCVHLSVCTSFHPVTLNLSRCVCTL